MSQVLRAYIIDLLNRHRLPLSDEKQLQAEMAKVFEAAGLSFKREVRLDARDIVDFMVDDLVEGAPAASSIRSAGCNRFRRMIHGSSRRWRGRIWSEGETMRGNNTNRWTEQQLELMQQLRADGNRWDYVAQRVGHPIASCQNTMTRFNNARRAAQAQAERKRLREAADALNASEPVREAATKRKLATPPVRIVGPAEPQGYASISTAKLVMHAELQSRIAVLGVTGGLLGDPLPGRSALDKRARR